MSRETPLTEAIRSAVLYPILSIKRNHPRDRPDFELLKGQVLGIWQQRAQALAEAGWEPARNLDLLTSCQWSITPGKKVATCHRSYVCPWCWSRDMVARSYHMLIQACLANGLEWVKHQKTEDYPARLIYFRRSSTFKHPFLDGWDFNCPGGSDDAFDLAQARAARVAQKGNSLLGAITTALVYPDRKGSRLRLFTAVVGAVKRDFDIEKARLVIPRMREMTTPSAWNLAKLAAFLCPYPASMMYCPPQKAVYILDARWHRHLIRSWKSFKIKGGGDVTASEQDSS